MPPAAAVPSEDSLTADSSGALETLAAIPEPVAPPPVLPEATTKGLVVVESKPPGATIYLDDKKKGAVGVTPWNGSPAVKRRSLRPSSGR